MPTWFLLKSLLAFLISVVGADYTDPSQYCNETVLTGVVTEYFAWPDKPITTTDALVQGWFDASSTFEAIPNQQIDADGCINGIGIPYRLGASSTEYPLTLYFSKSGQLSATSYEEGGLSKPNAHKATLLATGAMYTVNPNLNRVIVAFRAGNPEGVCDAQTVFPTPVVTGHLVVSPSFMFNKSASVVALNKRIPLNKYAAREEGWEEGSCFDNMGIHYHYMVGPFIGVSVVPIYGTYNGCNAILFGFLFEFEGASSFPPFNNKQNDPYDLPCEILTSAKKDMVKWMPHVCTGTHYTTMHMMFIPDSVRTNPDFSPTETSYRCAADGKTDCLLKMNFGQWAGCHNPGDPGVTRTNLTSMYFNSDCSPYEPSADGVLYESIINPLGVPFARLAPRLTGGAMMPPYAPCHYEAVESCSGVKKTYQGGGCCGAEADKLIFV